MSGSRALSSAQCEALRRRLHPEIPATGVACVYGQWCSRSLSAPPSAQTLQPEGASMFLSLNSTLEVLR